MNEAESAFSSLVMVLALGVLQHLGLIDSPVSGKREANLDLARRTIDTLEMLKVKTTGNLTADESRLLDESLHDLRLKYLDATRTAPAAKEKPAP